MMCGAAAERVRVEEERRVVEERRCWTWTVVESEPRADRMMQRLQRGWRFGE